MVVSLVTATASRLAVEDTLSCVVVRPCTRGRGRPRSASVEKLFSPRRGGEVAELRRGDRTGLGGAEGLHLGRGQHADLRGGQRADLRGGERRDLRGAQVA